MCFTLRSTFRILKMIVLCFSIQEGDVIEHTNGKCHMFILLFNWRPLRNIVMHLITLLNIL